MGKWGSAFDIVRDVLMIHRRYLTVYERDVLFFIFAKTRMYGKEWERISLNQFMHGYCTDRQQLDGVDMSETMFLASLRHLKGKGFIETRGTGMNTANEYRVKEEAELDVQHIETYLRRHQPKVLAKFYNRAQNIASIRRQVTNFKAKTVAEFQAEGTPKYGVDLPPNIGEGVPPNMGDYNIPTFKKPISTPSPKAATHGFRKINLPKGQ